VAARGLKHFLLLALLLTLFLRIGAAMAAEPSAIERDLVVIVQGEEKRVTLDEALALLNVPSVSIALIDEGRIAFARAYGREATRHALSGRVAVEIRCRHRRHASRGKRHAEAR
jgi:hypothetical protein